MQESPIIKVKLGLSAQEIIKVISNSGIIKVKNIGYILDLYSPDQPGNNPVTGEKITIPAKTLPTLLDPKIYINIEGAISDSDIPITKCDLLRDSEFQLEEINDLWDINAELIGSLRFLQRPYREYKKDSQTIQVSSEMVCNIVFAKPFNLKLKEESKNALLLSTHKDQYNEDKIIIDNIKIQET